MLDWYMTWSRSVIWVRTRFRMLGFGIVSRGSAFQLIQLQYTVGVGAPQTLPSPVGTKWVRGKDGGGRVPSTQWVICDWNMWKSGITLEPLTAPQHVLMHLVGSSMFWIIPRNSKLFSSSTKTQWNTPRATQNLMCVTLCNWSNSQCWVH